MVSLIISASYLAFGLSVEIRLNEHSCNGTIYRQEEGEEGRGSRTDGLKRQRRGEVERQGWKNGGAERQRCKET
jgi:hypothetical protein